MSSCEIYSGPVLSVVIDDEEGNGTADLGMVKEVEISEESQPQESSDRRIIDLNTLVMVKPTLLQSGSTMDAIYKARKCIPQNIGVTFLSGIYYGITGAYLARELIRNDGEDANTIAVVGQKIVDINDPDMAFSIENIMHRQSQEVISDVWTTSETLTREADEDGLPVLKLVSASTSSLVPTQTGFVIPFFGAKAGDKWTLSFYGKLDSPNDVEITVTSGYNINGGGWGTEDEYQSDDPFTASYQLINISGAFTQDSNRLYVKFGSIPAGDFYIKGLMLNPGGTRKDWKAH